MPAVLGTTGRRGTRAPTGVCMLRHSRCCTARLRLRSDVRQSRPSVLGESGLGWQDAWPGTQVVSDAWDGRWLRGGGGGAHIDGADGIVQSARGTVAAVEETDQRNRILVSEWVGKGLNELGELHCLMGGGTRCCSVDGGNREPNMSEPGVRLRALPACQARFSGDCPSRGCIYDHPPF